MSDSVDSAAISASPDSMGVAAKVPDGQSGTVVRSGVMRRLIRNPLGIASLVILGSIALLAIFAPVLAPFEENFANISKTLAAPDSVNILGTDSAGRDTWSRLLFGSQLTLLSALLCAGVAIAIGLPAGLIAGYYAGKFEAVSNWVVSILMSLPGLIVLLTIRAAFGPSVWISMIAFGVLILRCRVRAVVAESCRLVDPALRVVEQAALPADHVLHRAHLLSAALALCLSALAIPSVLGARVAQPVEHALQFRHALLRFVHPALASRLARLLRHPIQISVGEAPGVRVERHLVVVAPRLFRQRLQMALDRLLQLL